MFSSSSLTKNNSVKPGPICLALAIQNGFCCPQRYCSMWLSQQPLLNMVFHSFCHWEEWCPLLRPHLRRVLVLAVLRFKFEYAWIIYDFLQKGCTRYRKLRESGYTVSLKNWYDLSTCSLLKIAFGGKSNLNQTWWWTFLAIERPS